MSLKAKLPLISALCALASCQSVYTDNAVRLCLDDVGIYHRCGSLPQKQATPIQTPKQPQELKIDKQEATYSAPPTSYVNFKLLSEYVEQMVISMQLNLKQEALLSPIAVASFVQLDSTLDNTNPLGNQLAEAFISELQKVGYPMIDHKITGEISMTSNGDFVFSRNRSDIKKQQKIGYVLSGTMIAHPHGTIINARIVGLKTNVIVASAQQLIPDRVLNSIF